MWNTILNQSFLPCFDKKLPSISESCILHIELWSQVFGCFWAHLAASPFMRKLWENCPTSPFRRDAVQWRGTPSGIGLRVPQKARSSYHIVFVVRCFRCIASNTAIWIWKYEVWLVPCVYIYICLPFPLFHIYLLIFFVSIGARSSSCLISFSKKWSWPSFCKDYCRPIMTSQFLQCTYILSSRWQWKITIFNRRYIESNARFFSCQCDL